MNPQSRTYRVLVALILAVMVLGVVLPSLVLACTPDAASAQAEDAGPATACARMHAAAALPSPASEHEPVAVGQAARAGAGLSADLACCVVQADGPRQGAPVHLSTGAEKLATPVVAFAMLPLNPRKLWKRTAFDEPAAPRPATLRLHLLNASLLI